MNSIYLHVAINHAPVIAAPIGTLVLGYGMWRNRLEWQRVGLAIFVGAALAAVAAYLTGQVGHEVMEGMPGIPMSRIHEHARSAMISGAACVALGALAAVALRRMPRSADRVGDPVGRSAGLSKAALALGIVVTALMAWTAHEGGMIRHQPEFERTDSAEEHHAPGDASTRDHDD